MSDTPDSCPKCGSDELERKQYGRTRRVSCWHCSLVVFLGPRDSIKEAYIGRETFVDNAHAEMTPNEIEQWRASCEQRHFRRLIESGSTHQNARRLSRQRADLQLEAEIARVALQRQSFGPEARERARMSDDLPSDGALPPKLHGLKAAFDAQTELGIKGKGSRSGSRKRRKPAPKFDPARRFGDVA